MSKKVLIIHKQNRLLESEDMGILTSLVEQYGIDRIRKEVGEAILFEGDGGPMGPFAAPQATDMKGAINDPQDGKPIHSHRGQISIFSRNFYRGLWRNLPSIAVSCAKYGIAGTVLRAIGVIHYRNEQKRLTGALAQINPDRWADWGTTIDAKNGQEDPKKTKNADQQTLAADQKKQEKKKDNYDDAYLADFRLAQSKVNKQAKPFYIEYSNHEIRKVYAYDRKEAALQGNAIMAQAPQKYKEMNQGTNDGKHTYRIVFDDSIIMYITDDSAEKARKTAEGELRGITSFYRSIGISNAKLGKYINASDEGCILLTTPSVIAIYEEAPDPNKVQKLSAIQEHEDYTDASLGVKTYKARICSHVLYIAADDDQHALDVVNKLITSNTFRGILLSSNVTKNIKMYKYNLACGDIYYISESENAIQKEKADARKDALFKEKVAAMKAKGGPHTKTLLSSARFQDKNGNFTGGEANRSDATIPTKVLLARMFILSLIENGKETKKIYSGKAEPKSSSNASSASAGSSAQTNNTPAQQTSGSSGQSSSGKTGGKKNNGEDDNHFDDPA